MFLFFSKRNIIFKIQNKLYCVANYSTKFDNEITNRNKTYSYFFCKLLDMQLNKSKEMLNKYPKLLNIDQNDIQKSVQKLKKFEYTTEDIQNKPMILYVNSTTLDNRYKVLKECGFNKISITILSKFLVVMNRTIDNLKFQLILPPDMNVQERLENIFKTTDNIEIKMNCKYDDMIKLKLLRKEILNEYLRKKLNINDSDLNKLWKIYSRLQHKNYIGICNVINLLINDLNFTNERILNNSFLLYADADNIKRLINEIPELDKEDFKKILYKKPKIMMCSCDIVLKTIEYIKSYNISELAIARCLDILTLGSETVKRRLEVLNEIEEFRVLKTNPRILRLVHFQNKARYRLDYLNKLKMNCASLNILSSNSKVFDKYTRDGTEMNKGRDIIVFLSKMLQKSHKNVREHLVRHPNWQHIPITHMKNCYDYLRSKLFSQNDIYENLYIILYPIKSIDKKIRLLHDQEFYNQLNLNINYIEVTNSKILNLTLYLIESEYHFTGDGIWHEENFHQVENFNPILPDFLDNSLKIDDDCNESTNKSLVVENIIRTT